MLQSAQVFRIISVGSPFSRVVAPLHSSGGSNTRCAYAVGTETYGI